MRRTESLASLGEVYRPFILFTAVGLLTLQTSRILLIYLLWDRVDAVDELWIVVAQGLRFDVLLICAFIALPLSVHAVLFNGKAWRAFVTTYLLIAYGVIVLMEVATPTFISEFDLRPNILFVEYLKYPREILWMLWKGYKLSVLSGFGILAVSLLLFNALLARKKLAPSPIPLKMAIALCLIAMVLTTGGIRSSFGHRPANPSVVAFSNDLLVNDLALNSTYSTTYAIYSALRHERGIKTYGRMSQEEALEEVRAAMALPESHFLPGGPSTYHRPVAHQAVGHRPNLVIILEESLGAEFVGALGGLDLTPNLDALFNEGISFTNLYATGTRSVRGIEAIMTGFTPTAARSVVKLPKSQTGFFTIAELLRREGYATSFLYGGEAHFDNMQQFLVGNGIESVIEEKDFPDPAFKSSWGVSDEDLLLRAHQEFEISRERPFFSLVFTSSNHSPFEFPENKIELHQKPKAHVNNAVKYADYVLGEFFHRAKSSAYWENTIFLVVADHNSRVWGYDLVPIDRFKVPALILGGVIEPKKIDRQASQIDLIPTVLGLMGIHSPTPAIGIDLLRPDIDTIPGRAVMQYDKTQAYMQGDQVVIMKLDRDPALYIRTQSGLTQSYEQNSDLVNREVGIATWTTYTYQNRGYGLPESHGG